MAIRYRSVLEPHHQHKSQRDIAHTCFCIQNTDSDQCESPVKSVLHPPIANARSHADHTHFYAPLQALSWRFHNLPIRIPTSTLPAGSPKLLLQFLLPL